MARQMNRQATQKVTGPDAGTIREAPIWLTYRCRRARHLRRCFGYSARTWPLPGRWEAASGRGRWSIPVWCWSAAGPGRDRARLRPRPRLGVRRHRQAVSDLQRRAAESPACHDRPRRLLTQNFPAPRDRRRTSAAAPARGGRRARSQAQSRLWMFPRCPYRAWHGARFPGVVIDCRDPRALAVFLPAPCWIGSRNLLWLGRGPRGVRPVHLLPAGAGLRPASMAGPGGTPADASRRYRRRPRRRRGGGDRPRRDQARAPAQHLLPGVPRPGGAPLLLFARTDPGGRPSAR
jgi:hypothetical protein